MSKPKILSYSCNRCGYEGQSPAHTCINGEYVVVMTGEIKDVDVKKLFLKRRYYYEDGSLNYDAVASAIQHAYEALLTTSQLALIDKFEGIIGEDKVFKGGLDNGMSNQIHGYNVAKYELRQALTDLKGEVDG